MIGLAIVLGLALVAVGVVLGATVARHWDRGPEGFAVVFPTLEEAGQAWRPGARFYRLTRHGVFCLTSGEVDRAMVVQADRKAGFRG